RRARVDRITLRVRDDALARGRLSRRAREVGSRHVAGSILLERRDTDEDVVRYLHVVGRFEVAAAEITQGDIDIPGIGAGGLLRVHVDGAADRVLTLQRALRTAENFNAVEIVQ